MAGSVWSDTKAIRYYEDAVSRFNDGDSRGALIQLKNALKIDPMQLPARVLLGEVQLDLGDPGEAEKALLMAHDLGADKASIALPLARARNRQSAYGEVIEDLRPPEYPVSLQADLWVELAVARSGTGDNVGAEIALKKALALSPGHKGALLMKGAGLLQRKDFAAATPIIEKALAEHPQDAAAWFMRGSLHHAQGQLEAAITDYRRAADVDPGYSRALLAESQALLGLGQPEKAAAILGQLRKTQPLSLEAHFFYARAMAALGRRDEAVAGLDAALDLVNRVTPDDLASFPDQLKLAALVKYESRDYEGALGFLERYAETNPDDRAAQKQLARLYAKLDKAPDALRLLSRLRANEPDDLGLLVIMGDLHGELGDFLAADRYYRLAMEGAENDPALLARLGYSKWRQGESAAAIGMFRRLIDEDQETGGPVSIFLGLLYLSNGQYEEASRLADAMVDKQPGNLVARNLQAIVSIATGDRSKGRRQLQAILEEDPTFRPAHLNLAKLDIKEERYAEASRRLDRLSGESPDDVSTLRERARLAVLQGDRAAAIRELEKIRENHPRSMQAMIDLTQLYLQSGREEDALRLALDLEREVPDNVKVKLNLASVRSHRNELAPARNLLETASRLAGSNPQHLVSVASQYRQIGDFETSETLLRRVLESRPDSIKARREFAMLLIRQGQYDGAAAQVSAALNDKPLDTGLTTLLADIRMAQRNTGEASRLYRQALERDYDAVVVTKLHRALYLGGQQEEAFSEIKAWHEKDPNDALLTQVLADHHKLRGDDDEALRLYKRLVDIVPNSALAHNNLANLLLPIDAEQAFSMALRAYELAPEDPFVLDTLGWMLVQLGELERGLSHLREAVARDSQSPSFRFHLAVALEEYGNKAEARHQLRRALQMNVDFPERVEAEERLRALADSS
jgi:putative PEP-CTERM system TPR-repeat lipoprotein